MTDTLSPPVAPELLPDERSSSPRRPLVAGVRAALVAAALGLVLTALPVVVACATDPRAAVTPVGCARSAANVWLLAHGAALELPGGRLSLLPLGLTLLPLALLVRAGRLAARARQAVDLRGAARATATVVLPYALCCAAVAAASATATARPAATSAVLGGLLTALLGAAAGALRHGRLGRQAWRGLGGRTRRTLLAALVAVSSLLAAGSALVAGSLVAHADRAAELAEATAPGAGEGAGLLLLELSYVPTAVVWALSWLAGPGFAVGTGTAVGPFAHTLGAVPGLPLLAALPGAGVSVPVGVLALAVPLSAGALAGRWLHRQSTTASRKHLALDLLAVGGWAGAGTAVLGLLASGAAGAGRLVELGPSPWRVGLAVSVEVGLGALLAVGVLRRRSRSRPR